LIVAIAVTVAVAVAVAITVALVIVIVVVILIAITIAAGTAGVYGAAERGAARLYRQPAALIDFNDVGGAVFAESRRHLRRRTCRLPGDSWRFPSLAHRAGRTSPRSVVQLEKPSGTSLQ
jgi:hypothetical protein